MSIFFTIIIVLLFLNFWWYLLKVPSHQLLIQLWGANKLPKLVLKLAKIEGKTDVTWKDLDKSEEERVSKIWEKLQNATSIQLTFFYSQNLVYVQLPERSYFAPLDKSITKLVSQEVGTTEKDVVEFVLYREKGTWRKTSKLVGYLRKVQKSSYLNTDKEIELLFEFPENMITQSLFSGKLEKKFNLKKDVVADLIKNDFGKDEGIYVVQYDQENKSGCNFHFQL